MLRVLSYVGGQKRDKKTPHMQFLNDCISNGGETECDARGDLLKFYIGHQIGQTHDMNLVSSSFEFGMTDLMPLYYMTSFFLPQY